MATTSVREFQEVGTTQKQTIQHTIVKTTSHAITTFFKAIILPVATRVVQTYEVLSNLLWPQPVKNKIASFKQSYEKLPEHRHYRKTPLVMDARDFFEKIPKQPISECDFQIDEVKNQLTQALVNIETYERSQNTVIQTVYTALQTLVEKPVSKQQLDFAKLVYKQLSLFLRTHTDKTYLSEYQKHLGKARSERNSVEMNPAGYLNVQGKLLGGWHAGVLFLLKHLRKQIKLAEKQDKIQKLIRQAELTIPQDIVNRALDYLRLTWMHGTKAFVIKSACEKSNAELVPTGELRKRNIQVMTGELKCGVTTHGINQRALSGVNLPCAEDSIGYSNAFSFDINEERKIYNEFLEKKFSYLRDFLNDNGSFGRAIEALRRIQHHDPKIFENDRELFAKKLEEIYHGLNTEIFNKKPYEIFNTSDTYYSAGFYSFLKVLEEFEELVHNPPKAEEQDPSFCQLAQVPVVLASKTKYGIPCKLSGMREEDEEIYLGNMKLGKDIQVIFAKEDDIEKVQDLVSQSKLEGNIHVESMKVLEAAAAIDRAIGTYFYDIYSIPKWTKSS